ncbi:MAG: hypothetical protein CALGDGBN_00066 [Pseudomonadales bacterium]|nr:hypothetical protein [Pseudomonadales bacterium]
MPPQLVGADGDRAVDWGTLETYLESDDRALIDGFFADFLRHAQTALAEIDAAVATGDIAQAGRVAHRLKSSARMVGASRLADACQALESAGAAGDGDAVHARHPVLAVLLDAVLAAAAQRGIRP